MQEVEFLEIFNKFINIIFHEAIEILRITWPTIKSLLLTLSTLSLMIGLIVWAILGDRKILSCSLVAYTLVLVLDILLV